MGNLKCLKNTFCLFDVLIKYYKFLKKERKINLKVISQQDIGILFSDGLSNNYSAYKKKGYLPNIWSRNDSEQFIIEDIYERLCSGNIIPSEIKFKKELIDFIDSEIKKECLNDNLDESTESLIEDLKIFKNNEQNDLYLKAVIEYSNRKPGVMYLKKNDKNLYKISNLENKIGTTVKDWIDIQGCDWEDDTVESLFRGLNTDDVNNINWKRISYDSKEYEAWAKLITRDFKEEFIKPKEEIKNLFDWMDKNPKGIYNITGDGGVGKSFLLEGFQNELKNNNIPSVIYRLSLGKFSDYRTFIIEMSFQIKQILPRRTQEIQTRNTQITDLREQFIEYIYEVMFSNSINKIVLIIDGINEIPDDSISLLSIIPDSEQFPNGLYIVLSGREMNNKNVIDDVERLKSNNDFWTDKYIDKKSNNYINLLNKYIEKELNLKNSMADLIIKKADGVFLFVYHFCKAIKGNMIDENEIVDFKSFYPYYLKRIRETVGDCLYLDVFLPTIIVLAISKEPLTIELLDFFGIKKESVFMVMMKFKDFVVVENDNGNITYRIMHSEFSEFLINEIDYVKLIEITNRKIIDKGLVAYKNNWNSVNFSNPIDRYYILYILDHIKYSEYKNSFYSMIDSTYLEKSINFMDEMITLRDFTTALKLAENNIIIFDYLKDKSSLNSDYIELYIKTLLKKADILKDIGDYYSSFEIYTKIINLIKIDKIESEYVDLLISILVERYWINDILAKRKDSISDLEDILKYIESYDSRKELLTKVYIGLAWHWHFIDTKLAYKHLQKAFEYNFIYHDNLVEIECEFLFGRVSASICELDNAVGVYDRALNKLEKYGNENKDVVFNHHLKLISIESIVGFFDYGDYEKALTTVKKLEKVFNNLDFLERGYLNIWKARILSAFGNYEDALYLAEKVRENNLKFSVSAWLDIVMLGILSIINEDMGKYNEAKVYREEALRISRKSDDKWVIADMLIAEAVSIIKRVEKDKYYLANRMLNEAYELAKKADFKHAAVISSSFLAIMYINDGEVKKAYENSKESIEVLENLKYIPNCEEEEIFINHALVLKHMGDLEDSNDYVNKALNEIKRKVNLVKNNEYKIKYLNHARVTDIINKININWDVDTKIDL